jgi:hypothetical protein
MALFYFVTNTWEFKNDRMFWLREQILPADENEFPMKNIENTDVKEFFTAATKGGLVHLLKESEDRTQARKFYRRYDAL